MFQRLQHCAIVIPNSSPCSFRFPNEQVANLVKHHHWRHQSKWGFPKHEFGINWMPIMFCVPLKDVRMSISNHSRQPCVMPGSYLNVALGASMFIHTLDLLLYIQSWFDFQLHRNWIMTIIVLKNSDCNYNCNHNATIIISKHIYFYDIFTLISDQVLLPKP